MARCFNFKYVARCFNFLCQPKTCIVLGTHFFGTDISTCSGRKAFRGGSKSLAHRCSLGHGSSVVMSEMVQVMKERKTAGMWLTKSTGSAIRNHWKHPYVQWLMCMCNSLSHSQTQAYTNQCSHSQSFLGTHHGSTLYPNLIASGFFKGNSSWQEFMPESWWTCNYTLDHMKMPLSGDESRHVICRFPKGQSREAIE